MSTSQKSPALDYQSPPAARPGQVTPGRYFVATLFTLFLAPTAYFLIDGIFLDSSIFRYRTDRSVLELVLSVTNLLVSVGIGLILFRLTLHLFKRII